MERWGTGSLSITKSIFLVHPAPSSQNQIFIEYSLVLLILVSSLIINGAEAESG